MSAWQFQVKNARDKRKIGLLKKYKHTVHLCCRDEISDNSDITIKSENLTSKT